MLSDHVDNIILLNSSMFFNEQIVHLLKQFEMYEPYWLNYTLGDLL